MAYWFNGSSVKQARKNKYLACVFTLQPVCLLLLLLFKLNKSIHIYKYFTFAALAYCHFNLRQLCRFTFYIIILYFIVCCLPLLLVYLLLFGLRSLVMCVEGIMKMFLLSLLVGEAIIENMFTSFAD